MLTIRKFLRTLLGKATPLQIVLACVLGSLFGFLPITGGGWGTGIVLAVALLVLNANVFLAGLVAAGTKLISLATAPVAFELGYHLIDGPLQPLFRALINAPITAWLGFDSYLAVGGLAIGLVVGVGLGLIASAVVRGVRGRLAGLEEGSDAFKAITSRRSVRFVAWLVFGGIPKGGFTDLNQRGSLPIRPSGIVVSLVLLGSVGTIGWLLSAGIARDLVVETLTEVNGATVDLEDLRIDWGQGRLELENLAVCDSERLERDLVRANRLIADIDVTDVLRRRISIDLVEAIEVYNDVPRANPGQRVVASVPAVAAARPDRSLDEPQTEIEASTRGNLDRYLKTAGEWRDRLEQISKVLGQIRDRAPRLADKDSIPSQAGVVGTTRPEETLEEWLRRQVDLHGYAAVRASHLVEDHPTVLVRSIVAGGVRRGLEDDRRYDVYLDSVSSSPRLVDAPPSLRIRETRDELVVAVELASLSSRGGDDRFDLVIRNLPTEDISRQLVDSDSPPFSGGRLNITAGGVVILGPTIAIAAPIDVELLDSTIRLGGEAATIPRLRVRLDVGGSLADPEVAIDEDLLAESLREAGQAVLAEKAKSEAGKHLDDGLQRIEEEAGIDIPDDLRKGIGDAIGGGIGELFGGGKKP